MFGAFATPVESYTRYVEWSNLSQPSTSSGEAPLKLYTSVSPLPVVRETRHNRRPSTICVMLCVNIPTNRRERTRFVPSVFFPSLPASSRFFFKRARVTTLFHDLLRPNHSAIPLSRHVINGSRSKFLRRLSFADYEFSFLFFFLLSFSVC